MVTSVSGLAFPYFSSGLFGGNVTTLEMYFEGMGIAARRVDKLGLDIRSFKVPLKRAVQQVVIPSIQMNFHKHGRPRWTPLASSTVDQKGHAVPLFLTGALRSTMKQIGIWHIDTEKALITDLPEKVWYGVIHQAGASGHRYKSFHDEVVDRYVNIGQSGAIPARPFAMIQPEDEEAIEQVFVEWLNERIAAAGLGGGGRITAEGGGAL